MNNKPSPNLFPNIINIYAECKQPHPVYKNQYSILNKYQGGGLGGMDPLSNFSMELDSRLPKINSKRCTLAEKQNELNQRENQLFQSQRRSNRFKDVESELEMMKKYLLLQQRRGPCGCNQQCGMGAMLPFLAMNGGLGSNQCRNCGDSLNPRNNRHGHSSGSSDSRRKNKSDKQMTPERKKKRKMLIRKFRIAAIAVYFSIYFKMYSIKFTKNRYEIFRDNFLLNQGEKVKQDSYKITKSIQLIDLIELILKSPLKTENFSSLNLSNKKIEAKNKKQRLIPKKKSQRFSKALSFVNLYLTKLERLMINDKFIDYFGEIISIGTVNQSFFMDHLMTPQQIAIIRFSEKKGYAKIDQNTERVLLMIYIFIKHVMFKVLLRLKQKSIVSTLLKQQYPQYKGQKQEIYQFLDMATGILYILINNIYVEHREQIALSSNYNALKNRFKIQPAQILIAPSYEDAESELQIGDQNQLISGMDILDNLEKELDKQQHDDYLGFLVSRIEEFSENLRIKTKEFNRLVYQKVKEITLKQQYIVFQGLSTQQPKSTKGKGETMKKLSGQFSNTSIGYRNKENSMNKRYK